MPDDTSVTTDAIAAYAAGRPELEAATERFVEMVRELLDDAGINYLSVTGRTKSLESFAAKAERRHEGTLLHPNPLVDITDQIGVRVITFVPDDVTAVAKLLAEELAVIDDRDMGQETARAGRFSKRLGAVVYNAIQPTGWGHLGRYVGGSERTIARNGLAAEYGISTLLFEMRGMSDHENESAVLGQKSNGYLIKQTVVTLTSTAHAIADGSIDTVDASFWDTLPAQRS